MTFPIQQPGDSYTASHVSLDLRLSHTQYWLAIDARELALENLKYKDRIVTLKEGQIAELVAFVEHPDHDQHFLIDPDGELIELDVDRAREVISVYLKRKQSLAISLTRVMSRASADYTEAYRTHYNASLGGWHVDTYRMLSSRYSTRAGLSAEVDRVRHAQLSSLSASTVPPTQDAPTQPVELSPAFDPDVYTYGVLLPHDALGVTLGYDTDPSDMTVTVDVDGAAQVVRTTSVDKFESREYRVNVEWKPAPPE